MRAEIKPSRAAGKVKAPPSKSMAHRMLICAGLSAGESIVRNIALSQDIKATIGCLRALGADVKLDGGTAYIKGIDPKKPLGQEAILQCNESGSTLRFFIPICLLADKKRTLTGSDYLMTRPLSVYEKIAESQGLEFIKDKNTLTVKGRLKSGDYQVAGNISSQFISGLMFALPLLDSDSRICITPPVESRPYIDMTVNALKAFGVIVGVNGDIYSIKGGQTYSPADVSVEGDWSNAAFFEALNCAGSNVEVDGLSDGSAQGDKVCKILFEKIKSTNEIIDISDCPDLGPVLFAVAALCGGARFSGTRRLRMKESDRAEAMKQELEKLGVTVDVGENDVAVHSAKLHKPELPIDGHNDHRIVMAMAVLLTVTGGVIEGVEAVNKSFPDFFEKLQDLGVDLSYGVDQ